MPQVRSGDFRQIATIEKPARDTLPNGEKVVRYEPDYMAYVSIKGIRGSMVENAKQVAPEASHKIMLRFMRGQTLDESRRINIKGNIYDIHFVDDVMMQGRLWEVHVKQQRGAIGDQAGY